MASVTGEEEVILDDQWIGWIQHGWCLHKKGTFRYRNADRMNAMWTWRQRLGGCIVKTHNTRGVGKAQQLGERHATVSPGHLSPANPWCQVSGVWKMNKFCCWKPFHLWCLLWSTTQIHGIRNFESRESYQKIVMHTQVWEPPLPILVLSKNNPGMLKQQQQQQQIKINKTPQTFGLSS